MALMTSMQNKTTSKMAERRKDFATADFIQVGLIYIKIFGRAQGASFFRKSHIKQRTYRRIITGLHRGVGPKQSFDPTQVLINLNPPRKS